MEPPCSNDCCPLVKLITHATTLGVVATTLYMYCHAWKLRHFYCPFPQHDNVFPKLKTRKTKI